MLRAIATRARRSKKASKSGLNSPVRQKFSGCHWTPMQNSASGCLDRFDDAVRGRGGRGEILPEPRRPTGDAGCSPGRCARSSRRRQALCWSLRPGRDRDVVRDGVLRLCGSGVRSGLSIPQLGMSCTSVPPAATFSTCAPRQIASTGRSGIDRAARQVDLELVAAGLGILDRWDGDPRRRTPDPRRRHRSAARRESRRLPSGRSR